MMNLIFGVILTFSSISRADELGCACKILKRPDINHKEETARWMVHSLDWGVLSTISTRLGFNGANEVVQTNKPEQPVPFGNIYSFVDGTCDNSTGTPYIYGTYMGQSFADTCASAAVSLTLSEAMTPACGGNDQDSCKISNGGYGDPQNPVCARLVLSGILQVVTDVTELDFAKKSLFQRHSSMSDWPRDHSWNVGKIDIKDIWLIDYFGGASILDVEVYKAVQLVQPAIEDK
mmetsp:Transcript_28995/g.42993  ORF Transcript_28995/g.42993 Transcript_28995/m.42993 type:complete len:234 (+) Transcript_28995:176-877(+)|eukprot:CAMPEP_0195512506 /NCGR_PEP_ID=MMETSP0794_2-20130614/4436_1 /TAXON_ID=515487 /ORGANISM="Stephanopyxis turris, Strain CCMP 815" /LENGTH=233 /DNA_ID=CAMNT_0040640305 /DNA_START=168 /DNA_END=869 /DNA_ORIENTATION=+